MPSRTRVVSYRCSRRWLKENFGPKNKGFRNFVGFDAEPWSLDDDLRRMTNRFSIPIERRARDLARRFDRRSGSSSSLIVQKRIIKERIGRLARSIRCG